MITKKIIIEKKMTTLLHYIFSSDSHLLQDDYQMRKIWLAEVVTKSDEIFFDYIEKYKSYNNFSNLDDMEIIKRFGWDEETIVEQYSSMNKIITQLKIENFSQLCTIMYDQKCKILSPNQFEAFAHLYYICKKSITHYGKNQELFKNIDLFDNHLFEASMIFLKP